jgi:drug/metabolite transporter (DMT)-like permease
LFVLLWSTGFIAGKFGLPYAEPMTFLGWRFAIVVVLMLAASWIVGAPWPGKRKAVHIAVVGLLMHAGYLGGVFSSLHHGLPAGLSALILGERVKLCQWLGLALGFGGVILVLAERYGFDGGSYGIEAPALAVLALIGITTGSIYQKRYAADANLWTGAVIQYSSALVPMAVLAFLFETREVTWSANFIGAMAWLVLVLSVGTISLLLLLIRRGAVSKVASLFFLVPPVTVLMAWAVFGETLGPLALGGMVLAAIGVAMVQRG